MKKQTVKIVNYDTGITARFKNRRATNLFLKKIQTYDFVERTFTKFVLHTIKEEPLWIEEYLGNKINCFKVFKPKDLHNKN